MLAVLGCSWVAPAVFELVKSLRFLLKKIVSLARLEKLGDLMLIA
jgi:hypothetical protein